MKNAFYFILKALFVFKIFNFFIVTFWSSRKWLDWKYKVNFKIHDVTTWLTNNWNAHITQISQEVKAIRQWNLVN